MAGAIESVTQSLERTIRGKWTYTAPKSVFSLQMVTLSVGNVWDGAPHGTEISKHGHTAVVKIVTMCAFIAPILIYM